MVHKSISDQCVMLDKGPDDEEWMLVKCNAFKNPTVFGVVYGMQEGRTPKEKIIKMWNNITSKLTEYEREGWDIYLAGDMFSSLL